MDLDEALEHVIFRNEVVARPEWGPDDCVVRWSPVAGQLSWRTSRVISCPDMVAEDWRVIGHLQ